MKADLARLASDLAVWRATATSLIFATAAAFLSLSLSMALVSTRQKLASKRGSHRQATMLERMTDSGASLILVMPPILIGAGWFVLARHFVDVHSIAPAMVICVNAAMAMPFVVRMIRPAHDTAAARHDRLAVSLGIHGFNRFRLIDWPAMRSSMIAGFAFAMALSLGDLGVIALFGSETVQTLPYLLLARLGSYRTADAAGIALMLAAITFILMIIADRLGNRQ